MPQETRIRSGSGKVQYGSFNACTSEAEKLDSSGLISRDNGKNIELDSATWNPLDSI
jgi:hypothetical protein